MTGLKTLSFVTFLLLVMSCGTSRKSAAPLNGEIIIIDSSRANTSNPSAALTKAKPLNPLQIKYAGFLNIAPAEIKNLPLYGFIDNWLYTPYKWGGTSKNGIDCSAFMQKLLENVYSINIPRTSIEQFFNNYIEKFGSKKYLSEGDLVFFRTMDDKVVSHVGLYLSNRMFVNSSSSKGVSIASLDDPYWKKKYVAAGRVKMSMLTKKK